MKLTDQQEALLEFVKEWHGLQKRKYSFAPYWVHLYAVAEIVSKYVKTDGVIEIALCHDLLEDTACKEAQLAEKLRQLGYPKRLIDLIIDGVIGLTDVYIKQDFPDLNRQERRKLEAERLGKTSDLVQSNKYADLIDNTRSIATDDPGFARIYLKEIRYILDQTRNGNIDLLIDCCYSVKAAQMALA